MIMSNLTTQALFYMEKMVRKYQLRLESAQKRNGVHPDEINNLERKILYCQEAARSLRNDLESNVHPQA